MGRSAAASRRREWIAYAAAGWSLVYGACGVSWARGGAGFPFGRDSDPDADEVESLLAGVRTTAAPVIAGLGLSGAALAVALARSPRAGTARRLLTGVAWTAAGIQLLVVPDRRLVMAIAFTPMVLLRSRMGWSLAGSSSHPTGATFVFRDGRMPWPVVNQILLVAGGFLWAGTALVSSDLDADWATPQAAARWGRWAVAIAVVAPLPFIVTRWAWALGMPLGITEEFWREGEESGLWRVGSALATGTAAGAALTIGLGQRWGEVVPRWAPGLGGKPVPPAAAIAPAALVTVAVTSTGISYVRELLRRGRPPEGWGLAVPQAIWVVWGAALGAATLAYYLRRRGDTA